MAEELPNEPIFTQLLHVARTVSHVVIHDSQKGVNADYPQLLTDLLRMRALLRDSLPASLFEDNHALLNEDSPYVFLLANGNYDFIIGAFAILSIGGAVVPLPTGILPEEALYFMQKCKSTTILASRDHLELGAQLQHHATSNGLPTTLLPIQTNLSPTIDPTSPLIAVSPAIEISPHRPGLLLFTSGTTGPPKGVIHARRLFYNMRRASSPTDVFLSHCPPHWIGGTLPLIRHPLAGVRVEMIPSDPSVIWNRLRDGGVTIFLGPPRLWTLMMRHFQDRIATNLPSDVVDAYVRGARQLRVAHVTGSMPYNALLRFWREDIGRPLQVSYGSTELGGRGLTVTADTDITLERCIGRPHSSVTLRLSDGDHGEMMIKCPTMFSGYLDDEAATQAVLTDDGFYRTGDIAHRVGDDYVLDGRASDDFIKSKGYKIPILELELRLLELPFIAEGCILPVSDENNSGQVAALVRLSGSSIPELSQHQSRLGFLRDQLAPALPAYVLPTILRVLQDSDEIPRTASLKVLRRKAVEKYFALSDGLELPVDIERWDYQIQPGEVQHSRIWGWAGLKARY